MKRAVSASLTVSGKILQIAEKCGPFAKESVFTTWLPKNHIEIVRTTNPSSWLEQGDAVVMMKRKNQYIVANSEKPPALQLRSAYLFFQEIKCLMLETLVGYAQSSRNAML